LVIARRFGHRASGLRNVPSSKLGLIFQRAYAYDTPTTDTAHLISTRPALTYFFFLLPAPAQVRGRQPLVASV